MKSAPEATIRVWAQQTHDLVESGLGSAEARLFLGDWDLGTQYVSNKTPPGHPWLHRGLMRLSRLMDRIHSGHVGPGARLQEGVYRSSKRMISPKDQTRAAAPAAIAGVCG